MDRPFLRVKSHRVSPPVLHPIHDLLLHSAKSTDTFPSQIGKGSTLGRVSGNSDTVWANDSGQILKLSCRTRRRHGEPGGFGGFQSVLLSFCCFFFLSFPVSRLEKYTLSRPPAEYCRPIASCSSVFLTQAGCNFEYVSGLNPQFPIKEQPPPPSHSS
ncbi:hypothetical protein BDW42DRAFT_146628 [Aspergillus taichungensis]|uniref:Uncharacterized protein n=1 Tax=Aspergillus taichungensis TaxID=482145 RepID=A0A2J5HM36_9EURO|nr:hypothetical protein BDW42DRAFT_146628 [Aspergillus taichungensis]